MQQLPAIPHTAAQDYLAPSAATSPPSVPPPQATQDPNAYLVTQSSRPFASPDPTHAHSSRSMEPVANAAPTSNTNPSDALGVAGVDQLLRASDNGQDWWLQDQNQLALGFDNWTTPAEVGSGVWFSTTGVPGNVSYTSAPSIAYSSAPSGLEKALSAMESANAAGLALGGGNSIASQGDVIVDGLPTSVLGAGGFIGAPLGYDDSQWYA